MRVSLDGGKTFQEAPDGVLVTYEDVMVNGEDDLGEVVFNLTDEGLIVDVWVTDSEDEDYNIGTKSQMLGELVSELVEANV